MGHQAGVATGLYAVGTNLFVYPISGLGQVVPCPGRQGVKQPADFDNCPQSSDNGHAQCSGRTAHPCSGHVWRVRRRDFAARMGLVQLECNEH